MATLLIAMFALACSPSALAQTVPVGAEFQVSTFTASTQYDPHVAAGGNGDFVAVWTSDAQDGSGHGVFGQRYASGGSALGTEFQVNTHTPNEQRGAAVVADSDGDFVVTWGNFDQDGSEFGVFGRRYASNGSPLGAEFQVNSYTTGQQFFSDVAASADGDFVIIWDSEGQDGSGFGIFGQRYASSGTALGTEFQVNTFTLNEQASEAVAAQAGGFVVVWQSSGQDDPTMVGIFGQRYDSGGDPLGTEFQVNTYTQYLQLAPRVAAGSDGTFAVVWTSQSQDGSGFGSFGQRYASGGSALGTEFQVNTQTVASQSTDDVAADSDGFIVTWTDTQNADLDVFARRWASSGSALGTEFRVNTHVSSEQHSSTIASDGAAGLVVVWMSFGQDGGYDGIFGRRYLTVEPTTCAASPLTGCATPGKSVLLIGDEAQDGAGPKDKLVWKWLKGPLTMQDDFGNPAGIAAYDFCLYAGTAQSLAMAANIPPDGTCAGSPCWKPLGTKGYKRKDKSASSAGITRILLKGGAAGAAKILVKGKDGNLDLAAGTLPLDASADVIAQISNSVNTNCWQASFPSASIRKNTDTRLKAKTP